MNELKSSWVFEDQTPSFTPEKHILSIEKVLKKSEVIMQDCKCFVQHTVGALHD